MSNGDGQYAPDEEVEYLEQLLCEQIRTTHDEGFKRLQSDLHDAVSGLEKAGRELTDLIQDVVGGEIKKLIRKIPDELGKVVVEVVRERVPSDYGELVGDAERLSARVQEIANRLETGSAGLEYLSEFQATFESRASKTGEAIEDLSNRALQAKSLLGEIESRREGDSVSLARLTSMTALLEEAIASQDITYTRTTDELKGMIQQSVDGITGSLQLLKTWDDKMPMLDQIVQIVASLEDSETALLAAVLKVDADLKRVSEMTSKLESHGKGRDYAIQAVRRDAVEYHKNLKNYFRKLVSDLTLEHEDIIARHTGLLASSEQAQDLLKQTEVAKGEVLQELKGLNETAVGVAELLTSADRTISSMAVNLTKLSAENRRTAKSASLERRGVSELVATTGREISGSLRSAADSLSKQVSQTHSDLQRDSDEMFSGLDGRFDSVAEQISNFGVRSARIESELKSHIDHHNRSMAHLTELASETKRMAEVFLAFSAFSALGVSVGWVLWWWLTH